MKKILSTNNKHKTLQERIEEFEKLPDEDKGSIEPYDWGNDIEKENITKDLEYKNSDMK